MSLIALIDKYKTDLAVAWEADTLEVVDKYRAFGQELVKLSPFTHNRADMRTAVSHMMDLDFNHHARYDVVAYSMRRSALEDVTDISAREDIWNVLEVAQLRFKEGGDQKLRQATEDYVRKAGKSKAEEDLLKVKQGFERVYIEVDANYKAANEADPVSGQTAENYGQHIALERMQLDEVLELVRSL